MREAGNVDAFPMHHMQQSVYETLNRFCRISVNKPWSPNTSIQPDYSEFKFRFGSDRLRGMSVISSGRTVVHVKKKTPAGWQGFSSLVNSD